VKESNAPVLADREAECAAQLARFFPQAVAVRIPVQVTALRGAALRLREATVLEFGAPELAIFSSTLPLEFDDRVALESARNPCTVKAVVIAVQYHEGRKAVAVKLSDGPCDWVTQP
jgi:hypothetical protein